MGDVAVLTAPLTAEERATIRTADEGGVVEELSSSAALRQWLSWELSLWGEQLPAWGTAEREFASEAHAFAWWSTRLSLAQQVGIARLVFGSRGHFPLLYQIASSYSRDWLASVESMSPAALYQSILFAREMADPWSTALRDSRFFDSAEWLKMHWSTLQFMYPDVGVSAGYVAPVPGVTAPPVPPPAIGAASWRDYADGALEFAGVAWRTVARTAVYHTQRAASVVAGGDPERVTIDGRGTLFDPQLVEDWGRFGEQQIAGRLADLSAALETLPGGQVPSSVAGSAQRPSARAEFWMPGVRAWMSRVGDYSRRLSLRQEATLQVGDGYVVPPAWALRPQDAEQDEIWLQALALAGAFYVGGTCLPRLSGAARAKNAAEAARALAAAGAAAGVGYQTRIDPAGRTWVEPVRQTSSKAGSLLARAWRAMGEAWRFRKGTKIDMETLVKDSSGGLREVGITSRTAAGLSAEGKQAWEAAILRVAESRLVESLASGSCSPGGPGTVVNVSPNIGGPMMGPGANVAGLATGPASELLSAGARASQMAWGRLLAIGGIATAYVGSVGYAMWAHQEGAQCYGMAARQAESAKRGDLTQEGARGIAGCAMRITSADPWIPGLNVLDAWRGYSDAALFQAKVFQETARGVAPLSPESLTAERAKPNARPSMTKPAGPAPGGPAQIPPPAKAPEVAPTGAPVPIGVQMIRGAAFPAVAMDAGRIQFIAAENRESILLQEYADLFEQGSRLLWSDEGFAWPARARVARAAGQQAIVNTGPALRVYLLPDGRLILRLPKEHALFGPIKDRMRRAKARKAALFLPGISDLTRSTGLWLIQPEAHGILWEILLNTKDAASDTLSETERDLQRIVSQTNADGEDWIIDEAAPAGEQ